MIVIAIIAILAAILIVQWSGARRAAYDSEALTVARNSVLAAQVFYAQNDLSYSGMAVGDLEDIEPSIGAFNGADGNGSVVVNEAVQVADDQTFEINVTTDKGTTTRTWQATQEGVEVID